MKRQEDFQTQAKTYANKCGGTTQEKCAIMTDYVEGAKYGYQYALQNHGWIDIKEEKPTEENLYIVSDGQESSVAYWVENHWDICDDEIRYWMHIPQPPKKKA